MRRLSAAACFSLKKCGAKVFTTTKNFVSSLESCLRIRDGALAVPYRHSQFCDRYLEGEEFLPRMAYYGVAGQIWLR